MSRSLRARWASRRRWPLWHPDRSREEWAVRKREATDPSPVFALPVHNVRRHGPVPMPDPSGLSEMAKARRRLARMLAEELTNPPVPHVPGHDLLSVYAISLPVSRLASVEAAMRQSVVLPLQSLDSVFIAEGDERHVMFVHGDTYSIVFRMDGTPEPILVLVDELPGYAVRVDEDDSQRGRVIITEMAAGLMINLQAATART